MNENQKKIIILYILRILYNYTSYDYPVTQTDIAKYLNDIDISCSRKTVGRNLKCLMDGGLPVKRKRKTRGGYYYDQSHDTFFVRKDMKKGEK